MSSRGFLVLLLLAALPLLAQEPSETAQQEPSRAIVIHGLYQARAEAYQAGPRERPLTALNPQPTPQTELTLPSFRSRIISDNNAKNVHYGSGKRRTDIRYSTGKRRTEIDYGTGKRRTEINYGTGKRRTNIDYAGNK